MGRTNLGLMALMFSIIPCVAVAWAWVAFTGGGGRDFAIAVGVLIGARTFFATIEMLGGIAAWQLFGRKAMLQRLVASFQSPKAAIHKLADEDDPPTFDELPASLQVEILRWIAEGGGLMAGMQMESAITEAVKICWPRKEKAAECDDE